MPSIDERIVTIHFENAQFEKNIAQTIASLLKLNEALKLVGAVNGLQSLETASKNVHLATANQSASALKKNADFGQNAKSLSDIEAASNKVKLTGAQAAAANTASGYQKLNDTAAQSVSTLGRVSSEAARANAALQMRDATGRFAAIEQEARGVHLQGIVDAVGEAQKGFSILKGAASVALGTIAAQATAAGAKMATNFLGPIKQGFQEYETNINSVQTILSNTEGQKGAGLKGVNAALDELNHYADKTIYNFSEMTKNVGTFTAAGVDLKTAIPSIKGIANLAALSGSNSQQASTAMYQLSQAIASGKVGLQDWNSVVNAGMGGRKFQEAIVTTAQTMGTLKGNITGLGKPSEQLKINGQSFREAIMSKPGEKSFFTGGVLTTALKNLSGDLSVAQIKAQGFSEEQAKAIFAQGKRAEEAATSVKTFTQLIDTTKEAIGSGWSTSFKIIFGNFGEAKKTFNAFAKDIGAVVQSMSKARNDLLKGWAKLGGRNDLIEGLRTAFKSLISVVGIVKAAMATVFEPMDAEKLAGITLRFRELVTAFKDFLQNNKADLISTFSGFFAILSIGKSAISAVFGLIARLFGTVTSGQGSFLTFTAHIGDFLVALDEAIKSGASFKEIIGTFPAVFQKPLDLLRKLGQKISNFFSTTFGKGEGGPNQSFKDMLKSMNPIPVLLDKIKQGWDILVDKISGLRDKLRGVIDSIAGFFSTIGDKIATALNNADWGSVFSAINSGLLVGVILMFKKFFSGGGISLIGGGFFNKAGEALEGLTGAFKGLTGVLTNMQRNIQASILLKIAAALALLTVSIIALSLIPAKDLDKAMSALVIAFGELVGGMALLNKIGIGKNALGLAAVSAGLIGMATAIGILSLAAVHLGKLSTKDLAQGVAATTGLLAALVGASAGMGKAGVGLSLAAPGILAMSAALVVMTQAVKFLHRLGWKGVEKSMAAVAGMFTVFTAAAIPLSKAGIGLTLAAPGILAMAGALKNMVGAITDLSKLSWEQLGKGMAAAAAGFTVMGAAAALIPAPAFLVGFGMAAMVGALKGLVTVLEDLAAMDIKTIAKGMRTIATMLTVMVAAFRFTPPKQALAVAAAMYVMAQAITILGKSLAMVGGLGVEKLLVGLSGMAGIIAILGVAVAEFGNPAAKGGVAMLFVLSIALKQLAGAVVMLANLKLLDMAGTIGVIMVTLAALGPILSTFLRTLALAAPAAPALTALVVPLLGFGAALLLIGGAIAIAALGITQLLNAIGKLSTDGPGLLNAMSDAFKALVSAIPEAIGAFLVSIGKLLETIVLAAPKFVAAAVQIIGALLVGIAQVAPKLAVAIVALLGGIFKILKDKFPELVQTGFLMITALLKGISGNIGEIVRMAGEIIVKLLSGLAKQLPRIIEAGADLIVKFLEGLARNAPKVISAGAKMIVKFLDAITEKLPDVIHSAATLIGTFVLSIANELPRLIKSGARLVKKLMQGIGDEADGVANAAVTMITDFLEACANAMLTLTDKIADIVVHFLNGLEASIRNNGPRIYHAGVGVGDALLDGMKKGLKKGALGLVDVAKKVATSPVTAAKKALGIHSPSRVFEEIGGNVVEGFRRGLGQSHERVAAEGQKMGEALTLKMKRADLSRKLEELGIQSGKGFILGAKKTKSGIDDIAAGMALGFINTTRNTLQIRSPSKVMEGIGKDTIAGFVQGLRSGTRDDIKSAFTDLDSTITDQITTAKENISQAQDQLNEELEKKKPDKSVIEEARKTIMENNAILRDAQAAHSELTVGLRNQRTELLGLAKDYEAVGLKLDKAREKLKAAKDERTQAAKEYADKYNVLPEFDRTDLEDPGLSFTTTKNEETGKTKLEKSLQDQVASMRQYLATLAILRKQGLNDATYKQLLDQGLAGQDVADEILKQGVASVNSAALSMAAGKKLLADAATALANAPIPLETYLTDLKEQVDQTRKFSETISQLQDMGLNKSMAKKLLDMGFEKGQGIADELLAAGPQAIKSLNAVSKQLQVASKQLGDDAASHLYDAGVAAAEGLVKGLRAQRKKIKREMEEIAEEAIAAVKNKLQIRSPSRVFAEIGKYTAEGLALGLRSSSQPIKDAATELGTTALSAMQDSVKDISDAVATNIDMDPTITPVLDLSQVEASAKRLGSLTSATPVSATLSYDRASTIAMERDVIAEAEAATAAAAAAGPQEVNYNQYITSPEAVSDVEIYRQTRNGLAQFQKALGQQK